MERGRFVFCYQWLGPPDGLPHYFNKLIVLGLVTSVLLLLRS